MKNFSRFEEESTVISRDTLINLREMAVKKHESAGKQKTTLFFYKNTSLKIGGKFRTNYELAEAETLS